jgi:hypothetical protein
LLGTLFLIEENQKLAAISVRGACQTLASVNKTVTTEFRIPFRKASDTFERSIIGAGLYAQVGRVRICTNVPASDPAHPLIPPTPHPRSRVYASAPTLQKVNHSSTRDFFLITKLLPDVDLPIMKPYTEVEVHDAIVAIRDGMPVGRHVRPGMSPGPLFGTALLARKAIGSLLTLKGLFLMFKRINWRCF